MALPTDVQSKLDAYPPHARRHLLQLAALVFAIAEDRELGPVAVALKWGEPSFSVKNGSPVRMDHKAKSPDCVQLYFNCNTSLVETFRALFSDTLTFDGKRAIRIPLAQPIDVDTLTRCLVLAMEYKQRRALPLLGEARTLA